jgi:glycosyltransferase involved in cell wall biosynthesis
MEYLIVDGGSTDGSLEIIHKYADRLSWWTSEQDRGQADGINKGLHHAKGDIVAWINSDDFYLPGAVTEAVRALQAHPEAGFVYSDLEVVDENGEKINRIHYGHWGLRELMEFRIIGQPTVFMRREVLQQAGYLDESFHFLLDHHLWLRLASLSGMTYIPQLWLVNIITLPAKIRRTPENLEPKPGASFVGCPLTLVWNRYGRQTDGALRQARNV